MLYKEHIKRLAREVGFDLCGVVRCGNFVEDGEFLRHWLDCGYGSSLDYMGRNVEKRIDTSLLVEGAKSVVVCALSYKNEISEGYPPHSQAKIASYACMEDYHLSVKRLLRTLFERLRESAPSLQGRLFTDSAPLFEKRYAVEAGLGWIGRQSLLVTPEYGTFVVLGEMVLCSECDSYDEPYVGVGCGECRRCVEACPNGAVHEGHIDTRLCISRATIEREWSVETPTHGWIFGCDECQSCCPYNRRAPRATNPVVAPLFDPRDMGVEQWREMSEEEFKSRFAQTPMSRTLLERVKKML